MSPITWTPDALTAELRAYRGSVYRDVEARHQVATTPLTDSLAEQELLENEIERHKPPLPADLRARNLHYLLATPFRYAGRQGSRFNRAGDPRGVFYAGETVQAALAERAFYVLLSLADTLGELAPWQGQRRVFAVDLATQRAIDLTQPPFAAQRQLWIDPVDYSACEAMGEAVRDAAGEAIRYESARDPDSGCNLAVLDPAAFAQTAPDLQRRQTWHVYADIRGVRAQEDFTGRTAAFPTEIFENDPRLAPLRNA